MSTNPAAQFKAGVDSNDLQAFENTNGVKIPQELVSFFTLGIIVYISTVNYTYPHWKKLTIFLKFINTLKSRTAI